MNQSAYKDRKYDVVPYDQNWPNEFESAAAKIRSVFNDDAIDIQHIGSTAVPDMDGKPCIDILVTVNDISVADKHRAEMEALGYIYAGDFVRPESVLFRKMNGTTVLSNVHIFPQQHSHVQEMLRLRDYLRSNPGEVKDYSQLKQNLYTKYKNDYAQYRKYKDEYMETLKQRALDK
ncbi:MAG: GrpB family protein [Candidatus Paceibacterota bacterium]|jgi:GrpB-like predicted nucleotidyltransferase (UPF0157 family)